jgi:predicted transcriptional regulator
VSEQDRALLLSVRPRFAESIMAGTKLAEIRRQRPGVDPGTLMIIYATVPVAAIIGTARILDIQHGTPADVWSSHRDQVGVSRQEFDEYFSGTASAYALVLTDPQRLACPLTLDNMRSAANFHPPRSYRYLTRSALRELVNGHPSGDSLLMSLPVSRVEFS